MWGKTYVATFSVFAFILFFVVYYAASWLGSITAPVDAFAGYEYFRSFSWYLLWITTAILLVVANVVLVKRDRSWAMWSTFAYFCFFVLGIGFLLPIYAIGFLREHGFAPETQNYLSPFLALGLCVAVGALVFGNRLLVKRMRDRIVGHSDDIVVDDDDVDVRSEEVH